MPDEIVVHWIQAQFGDLVHDLDGRARRRWAATDARSPGRGGIAAVSQATGIRDRTTRKGIRELESYQPLEPGRRRRPGGGGKLRTEEQPGLPQALDRVLPASVRGLTRSTC